MPGEERRLRGTCLPARPPQDRPEPSGGVLQVRAGVAGQRDHPVQVERVARIVRNVQVGVLDGSDPDHPGDGDPLLRAQVPAVLVDHGRSTLDSLVEQGPQLQGGTTAGLEDLAVQSEHVADLDVNDLDALREPPGRAGGSENHLEVQALGAPIT